MLNILAQIGARWAGTPLPAPTRVQFEVANCCNLACPMCPRDQLKLPQTIMPLEVFRAGLASCPPGCKITLTGWGEPLLNRDLFTMVREARARGHQTAFTSNGILLDRHLDAILDSGLDALSVSLDSTLPDAHGHGDASKQLANLQALQARARERGLPCPTLSLLTTLQDDGGRGALSVVEAAARLRVARMVLVRLNIWNPASGLKRPDLVTEIRNIARIERAARRHGLRVDHNGAFFTGVPRVLYRLLRPWLYRGDTVCPKPLDFLYVRDNGDVTPCCDLPHSVVGNVMRERLLDIWNGAAVARFRQAMPERCRHCDHLFLRQKY